MAAIPTPQEYSFSRNLTYGTLDDSKSDFLEVSFDTALDHYKEFMHAAHGLIFTREKTTLWERYTQSANAIMQTRFDGTLGFPGGLLDTNQEEPVVDGLNRELVEEINFDVTKHAFVQSEHLMTNINKRKRLVLHFYTKEVTAAEFCEIERRVLDSEEWGRETFGIVRVPLFVMAEGFRGFPVFLANEFVGNAKGQLLRAIREKAILPEEELNNLIEAHKLYLAQSAGKS